MALETATYIDGLVPANPLGSDAIAFADDHIRLIKSTIKTTFPNIKGAVTASHENLNNGTPVGLIAMWSGGTVPAGWALCNGQTVAKADGTGNITTPDLRDRFIVGTGGAYTVGNTGGASQVALTTAQMPSHSHTGSTDAAGNHQHFGTTNAIGDHSHTLPNLGSVQAGSDNGGANVPVSTGYASGRYMSPTDSAGAHSHQFTTDIQGIHQHTFTTGSVGSGAAHENRPPYYALAFIMKV